MVRFHAVPCGHVLGPCTLSPLRLVFSSALVAYCCSLTFQLNQLALLPILNLHYRREKIYLLWNICKELFVENVLHEWKVKYLSFSFDSDCCM